MAAQAASRLRALQAYLEVNAERRQAKYAALANTKLDQEEEEEAQAAEAERLRLEKEEHEEKKGELNGAAFEGPETGINLGEIKAPGSPVADQRHVQSPFV